MNEDTRRPGDGRLLALAMAAGLVATAACTDGTGPGGTPRLTVSAAVAPAGAGAAAADSFSRGGHTLVLDRVELVLKEIELKRVESYDCDDDRRGGRGSDDACEELVLGPLLLDLPLTGVPARIVTVDADTGTFREVEFKVHKPEDDPGDRAFLDAHPEFRRVSIRVRGRYDGQTFVYLTDLGAEQEYDLVPPLVVREGTATNLTLTVDLARWFLVNGQLVNPLLGLKGQPLESPIKENIKRSFEVFEDRDRDGRR